MARATPAGLAAKVIAKWKTERFHSYLSEKLVDVAAGRIKRLIVTVPPRHGKSTLCSHIFPAWYLGNFPDRKVILCSYEADYAKSWGRKAREVLEEHGMELFGVTVAPGSSSASAWETVVYQDGRLRKAGGGMWTAGAGGPITGKGAHCLIIDDPIKNADDARSAVKRQSQKDWFRSVALSRLESDPEGAMIIILTRWHEDDLAGWQMAEMLNNDDPEDTDDVERWTCVDLPAIAGFNDVLGRQPGEALSCRYPIERLQRIRKKLGPYWFGALYQQTPAPAEGTVFKQGWLRYAGRDVPLPTKFDNVIQVWDTAFKVGELNDYSACATFGLVRAKKKGDEDTAFLLHIYRDRLEMPGLIQAIKNLATKYQPSLILVEDKGSGTSAVQTLRAQSKLPIQAQPVKGDKVSRAHTITPYLEQGRVVICKFPALAEFETELFTFPLASHDDMVDVFVYGLQRLFGSGFRAARQHNG